ncbi:hypothetical protein OSG_eHP22_00225 [environmental Halophage eHP-22]|nr:hypothetical protein OSG_eHP22_00225 [environmental Halophage eHP-22]
MVDDGYLIGYEDAQGNFVQIGQFNNVADDVTQPIEIIHTNSGETIALSASGTTVNNKTVALSRSHTVPTSYFSGPAHGEGGNAFRGASILPDGRAVFAPTNSSNVAYSTQRRIVIPVDRRMGKEECVLRCNCLTGWASSLCAT